MVAVHAWRSADAIERFKARYPANPVVLQLSGTDIYQYLRSDPAPTLRAMKLADRMVGLNDLVSKVIPKELRKRLRIIFQSAPPPTKTRRPATRSVIVAVIGHLRDVKDPLRTAAAARLLPAESRIRIEQVGRAYTAQWAARARAEMKANKRYRWRDDVPPASVRRLLARSHAMVISSVSEGGANVISEAAVAGVPILASRMDGNVGLLGSDYPGYFPVGDTRALARLLERLEQEPAFARLLATAIARRAPLFRPAREIAAWRRLLAEVRSPSRLAAQPGAATSRALRAAPG